MQQAANTPKYLNLELPMLAGQQVVIYNDNYDKETYMEQVEVSDDAEFFNYHSA